MVTNPCGELGFPLVVTCNEIVATGRPRAQGGIETLEAVGANGEGPRGTSDQFRLIYRAGEDDVDSDLKGHYPNGFFLWVNLGKSGASGAINVFSGGFAGIRIAKCGYC